VGHLVQPPCPSRVTYSRQTSLPGYAAQNTSLWSLLLGGSGQHSPHNKVYFINLLSRWCLLGKLVSPNILTCFCCLCSSWLLGTHTQTSPGCLQDLVQAGLEYLQRRRIYNLSGQPDPVLCHPQSAEVLPHVQLELPVLQVVPWIMSREEQRRW